MLSITRLIWDDWTIAHIARHGVTPQEVDEACQSNHVARQAHTGRLILIGITSAPKIIAVILNPQDEEGVYYVVTRVQLAQKRGNFIESRHKGVRLHDRRTKDPNVHES